jgi:hypothetical protein
VITQIGPSSSPGRSGIPVREVGRVIATRPVGRRHSSQKRRHGDRATIHATRPRGLASEVEAGPEPPRGGSEPGDQPRGGWHHGGPGPRGRARLGPRRGGQRRGAGGARVRAPDAAHARPACPGLYFALQSRKFTVPGYPPSAGLPTSDQTRNRRSRSPEWAITMPESVITIDRNA